MIPKITDLFDLSHTMAAPYLSEFTYPWEALKGIGAMIVALGTSLDKGEYEEVSPQVWVHKSAATDEGAVAHLRTASNDAGAAKIGGGSHLGSIMYPHLGADLEIIRAQLAAKLHNQLLDALQGFPGVGKL